jgi:hypothetical protein
VHDPCAALSNAFRILPCSLADFEKAASANPAKNRAMPTERKHKEYNNTDRTFVRGIQGD